MAVQARILCVDDNKDNNLMLKTLLEFAGFQVTCAMSVVETKAIIPEKSFDLYILDQQFEDGTGIELCLDIRIMSQQVPIIFYSGNSDNCYKFAATAAGANAYLVKPDELEKIEPAIIELLSRRVPRS
jgi:DNA-binding response OmpR family regulator